MTKHFPFYIKKLYRALELCVLDCIWRTVSWTIRKCVVHLQASTFIRTDLVEAMGRWRLSTGRLAMAACRASL